MCLRYCVLGFAAHSNISGVDCVSDDDCFMDDDCFEFSGYGIDFEKCVELSYD